MFDTELLKSFLAVAENGGFTRAAKALTPRNRPSARKFND